MLFDLKTVTHVSGPNRHLSRRLHNWQAAGWPVELRGADPNPMENKGHGEEGGVVCLVSGDGKKPGRDEARTTEGQRRRKARTGEGHGPENGTDRATMGLAGGAADREWTASYGFQLRLSFEARRLGPQPRYERRAGSD